MGGGGSQTDKMKAGARHTRRGRMMGGLINVGMPDHSDDRRKEYFPKEVARVQRLLESVVGTIYAVVALW